MKQSDLPDADHFARYVSGGCIVPDEDGDPQLTPGAFRIRPGEEGLSGAWFECGGAHDAARVECIVAEWKSQDPPFAIRKSGRIALACAGKVKAVSAVHSKKVKVRHEPAVGYLTYAQIRGLLEEDHAIVEAIARDAVVRLLRCLEPPTS